VLDGGQLTRILVVEDEKIIAMDIEKSLDQMGYKVTSVVSTGGEEAIKKAQETRPDLVLMDIVLKGYISGIEAAQRIRESFDIPVVYLTGYADEDTIERAKVTESYGYILKPYKDAELKTAIEMAIYKHKQEKKRRQRTRWLNLALKNIRNAIITTDTNACVTFLNPVAEDLTGWKQKEALGKDLTEVLKVLDEKLSNSLKSQVTESLTFGVEAEPATYTIIDRDGTKKIISDSISPIKDEKGDIAGSFLMFHEVLERKRTNKRGYISQKREQKFVNEVLPINLVLASSSPLIRSGARNVLDHEYDMEVISEASSFLELLQLIDRKTHDVLFLDSSLPDLDFVKIQQAINENNSDTKILLLLHAMDEDLIINAIYCGVQGFVKETSIPSDLVGAVRSINKDEIWIERHTLTKILKKLLGTRQNISGLLTTALIVREREIVELIAQGHSNKQISQKLSISRNTCKKSFSEHFQQAWCH
jgi:PAS domain S-box-containing protein